MDKTLKASLLAQHFTPSYYATNLKIKALNIKFNDKQSRIEISTIKSNQLMQVKVLRNGVITAYFDIDETTISELNELGVIVTKFDAETRRMNNLGKIEAEIKFNYDFELSIKIIKVIYKHFA